MAEEKIDVLVVDDKEDVLRFFVEASKKLAVAVTTCKSGEEAVEKVKAKSFRIVFLDTQMPGMGSLVTFKTIREINPNLAVFMMTSSATDDLLRAALEEGARGAIYRPPELEKIANVIQKIEVITFVRAELERAIARAKVPADKERERIEELLKQVEEMEKGELT